MSNTTYPARNPDTSLAFLSPGSASQLEVYRYLAVATLGAYLSNLVSHARVYYKLLCVCRITYSTMAYCTSIFGTLFYIIGCVVFHIGRVPNCQILSKVVTFGYAFAIPATSMLFFLRVRALFPGERHILIFFSILWLGVLGCAMSIPFSLSGSHIGPTQNCIDSNIKGYSSAGIIAATIFDSLVFFSVSWRLLGDFMTGSTMHDKARAFCGGGRTLPVLSRCLLQSGQLYYLITVVSNVATVVMILSHSVPPILHAALTTPNAALTNAMACKVFIDIKFGDHTTNSLSIPARTQHHIFSTIQGELPVFRQEKSTTVNNDLIISGVRVTMGPTRDHLPADDPAPSVNQLA